MYVDLFVICMPVAWSHIFFFFFQVWGGGGTQLCFMYVYACICMRVYTHAKLKFQGGGIMGFLKFKAIPYNFKPQNRTKWCLCILPCLHILTIRSEFAYLRKLQKNIGYCSYNMSSPSYVGELLFWPVVTTLHRTTKGFSSQRSMKEFVALLHHPTTICSFTPWCHCLWFSNIFGQFIVLLLSKSFCIFFMFYQAVVACAKHCIDPTRPLSLRMLFEGALKQNNKIAVLCVAWFHI